MNRPFLKCHYGALSPRHIRAGCGDKVPPQRPGGFAFLLFIQAQKDLSNLVFLRHPIFKGKYRVKVIFSFLKKLILFIDSHFTFSCNGIERGVMWEALFLLVYNSKNRILNHFP